MWFIFITSLAKKHLARIPEKDRVWIANEVEKKIRTNPLSGDLVKLTTDSWRRRMGNYRIIFQLNPKRKVVFILGITRRTSTTY